MAPHPNYQPYVAKPAQRSPRRRKIFRKVAYGLTAAGLVTFYVKTTGPERQWLYDIASTEQTTSVLGFSFHRPSWLGLKIVYERLTNPVLRKNRLILKSEASLSDKLLAIVDSIQELEKPENAPLLLKFRNIIRKDEKRDDFIRYLASTGVHHTSMLPLPLDKPEIHAAFSILLLALVEPRGQNLTALTAAALKDKNVQLIVAQIKPNMKPDDRERLITAFIKTDIGQKLTAVLLDVVDQPHVPEAIHTIVNQRPLSISANDAAKIGGEDVYRAILKEIEPQIHYGNDYLEGIFHKEYPAKQLDPEKPVGQVTLFTYNGIPGVATTTKADGELARATLYDDACVGRYSVHSRSGTNTHYEKGVPVRVNIQWNNVEINGLACFVRAPTLTNSLAPLEFRDAAHVTLTMNVIYRRAKSKIAAAVQSRLPLLPSAQAEKLIRVLTAIAPNFTAVPSDVRQPDVPLYDGVTPPPTPAPR